MYPYLGPGAASQCRTRGGRSEDFWGGSHYFASRGAREAGNRRLSPRLHGGVACYTGLSRGTRQVARFGRPQSRSSVSAAVGRGATYVSASSHLAINVSSLHVKGGEMRFRFAGHHRSRRMPPAWLCPSIAGRRTRRCLLELGRMTRSWGLAIADNATVHPGKLGGVVSRFDIFFFGLMIASPVRSGWIRPGEGTCQFPSRIPTPISYSVSPSRINLIIPPRAEPRLPSQQTSCSPPCPFEGHESSYESMATKPRDHPRDASNSSSSPCFPPPWATQRQEWQPAASSPPRTWRKKGPLPRKPHQRLRDQHNCATTAVAFSASDFHMWR